MTVAELIAYLQTQPQDLQVAYSRYSEQCLLSADDIEITDGQSARPDGWIGAARPDRPTEKYLLFPGN